MLKSKVRLTQYIRNKIQEERNKINKTGIELSGELGKSDGWISLVENGRILTVTTKDLVSIFKILLKVDEFEAQQYIENLLNESIESLKKDGSIVYYDEQNQSLSEENFKKIITNITFKLNQVFKDNPKYVFSCAGEFMENLDFDIGLILALIKMPFYKLENTDFETRQELLKDFFQVIQKYIKKQPES